MTEHKLKTWMPFFALILDGSKTFDLRPNDRDFQLGDKLILQEYDQKLQAYTGRELTAYVTYITDGKTFGALTDGWVCMAIRVERVLVQEGV